MLNGIKIPGLNGQRVQRLAEVGHKVILLVGDQSTPKVYKSDQELQGKLGQTKLGETKIGQTKLGETKRGQTKLGDKDRTGEEKLGDEARRRKLRQKKHTDRRDRIQTESRYKIGRENWTGGVRKPSKPRQGRRLADA